ncbi:MAG: MBL fold metallo-hydrolase [Puniceicoccales bacterium]|jgi:Cft2 family RNA processing exonuclease|nr:MBL fold metallo-hydrolase [Puniceicoccales bacterium]
MRLIDLNRTRDIGSSCLFAEIGSFNILFDCGTSPKCTGYSSLPDFKKLGAAAIDLILISHCHLDHVGSVPYLIRKQQQARILISQASHIVLPRILNNSVTVMKLQRDEHGIKEYPFYTATDIEAMEQHILPMQFGKSRTLRKDGDEIVITFFEAGHVLGASSILVEHKHRKIFYTGDVLFRDQKTLRGAKWPSCKVDTIITETTRGTTVRKEECSPSSETERLVTTIRNTIDSGGSVLIPAFAFGRMQEILKIINSARKEKKLQANTPIFCSGLGYGLVDDFDMAAKKLSAVDFRRKIAKELNIKIFRGNNPKDIKKQTKEPSIFVLSSGMLVENTSAYNVASALIDDHRNAICFVGFCDDSTPGGELQKCSQGDSFLFKAQNYVAKIFAKMYKFDMSGHADREEILKKVIGMSPRAIVLVHGEEDARNWFMDELIEVAPKVQIWDMNPGEEFTI